MLKNTAIRQSSIIRVARLPFPRWERLVLIAVAFSLAIPHARADGVSDANAGVDALGRGEYTSAVDLFTQAIQRGQLSSGDIESAYVERAKAYMGLKNNAAALNDLARALSLDPNDTEAAALRGQMQLTSSQSTADADNSADLLNSQVKAKNDALDAKYQAAVSSFQAAQSAYEAQKKAVEDQKAADAAAYAAQMEAWRAKVAACNGGDRAACAN